MVHGFVSMYALIDAGSRGLDESAAALREALAVGAAEARR
jgi:hypothetical protein